MQAAQYCAISTDPTRGDQILILHPSIFFWRFSLHTPAASFRSCCRVHVLSRSPHVKAILLLSFFHVVQTSAGRSDSMYELHGLLRPAQPAGAASSCQEWHRQNTKVEKNQSGQNFQTYNHPFSSLFSPLHCTCTNSFAGEIDSQSLISLVIHAVCAYKNRCHLVGFEFELLV